MRKVFYIVGSTASGKTTTANKLGQQLGIPVLHADDMLEEIAEGLMYNRPEKLALREFEMDFNPLAIKLLKIKAFQDKLAGIEGDFIIEGFTLGYEYERKIIDRVLGEHKKVLLHLAPTYDKWEKLAKAKGYNPSVVNYDIWRAYYQPPRSGDWRIYTITDPDLGAMPTEQYQREGLTDTKWQRLCLGRADLERQTVLDLGCNDGWFGKYCLENGAAEATGIDVNWRNLEHARERGVSKVLLRDFNDPTWAKGLPQYDVVLALAMLHYVEDKDAFIATCAKLTRKLFVLELPVSKNLGWGWENYHDKYLIPTVDLITKTLKKYFKVVEQGEQTPAPDGTTATRFVFKAKHS